MKKPVRILIIEDKPDDADLATHEIRRILHDCEFQVVETREGFIQALETFQPDVVLSDYTLPRFDGMQALRLTLQHAPLTPLIIWTGSIREDAAVECVKAGANNYILKENLKQLGPATLHALEEKELLAARKQADQKYQSIFENSMEGIFQSSPEGRYLSLNPAMARLYGYTSPKEMIESIQNIATQIYVEPEKRSLFVSLLESQNSVENFEARNYRKDGSIIWISTSARIVRDQDGKILYYEGFLQDISRRKRVEEDLQNSEKRFRALIENGLDDISLLAVDGTLLWESPSTIRNLGYAPNEYVGRNIFELMHPEDLEWTRSVYQKLLKEPGSRQRGTFRLRRADGAWRWVEAIASNMLSEPGVNAIVINYHDITEQKQADDELQRRNADLALINALNELVNRGEGLDVIVDLVRNELKRIFSSEYTNIYLLDQERQSIQMQHYSLPPDIVRKIERVIGRAIPPINIPVQQDGFFQRVLRAEQGMIISGPEGIQRWMAEFVETVALSPLAKAAIRKLLPQIYRIFNIKSTVLVPLISDGKPLGLVNVSGPNLFTEQDRQRIENICGQLTTALQRQQVEEALRESQSRYQNLVETSHDLIWSVDAEGRITFMNRAAREIYGYEPEELIGRSFIELMSSENSQPADFAEIKDRIGQTNEFTGVESLVRHRDGRQITLSANSKVLRDEQGHITGITGSSHDITDRKRAEEALKEERNLLRTLIDNIPDRIYAMDRLGRKTLSNTADWRASGGKTMEDVIGKTDFDTYPPELAEEFWRLDQAVLDSGQPVINIEEPGLDPDGNLVSILTSKIPLCDDQGNVIGLVGVGRDITERKQVEEALRQSQDRYRTLIETQTEFIVRWKPDGIRTFANESYCRYFSITLEQALSSNFMDLIHETDRQNVEAKIQRLKSGATSVETALHQVIKPDGSIGWQEWTDQAIRDENGNLVEFQSVGRDITERKRAEEEIRRRAKETSALLETSLALTSLDLEATLQTVGNSANTLFLADGCRIFLMEPDGETLRCVLALDENIAAFSNLSFKLGQGVTGAVAASGKAEIVNEMQNDPRAVQIPGTPEEQEAIMFAPLKERDHTIGILSVRRVNRKQPFHQTELELLEAFASMAASAVSNARLFEETRRRLAELRASEERFRQLADNIQEAFWMTDAENDQELYMSPAAERIWGRSIQNLMYEPNAYINTVFSEDRPVVLDAIERQKRGERMQLEYRIVRPDGTLRWIWDRAFPIFDDTGKVRKIAGISADISERRESELALVKSQNRYQELFDSSPISIWEEDYSLVKKQIDSLQKNGVIDLREYLASHPEFVKELASMVRIIDVNKASLELYGIDRKEDMLLSLGELLDSTSLKHFADEIIGLMSPLKRFSWEGGDVTNSGRHIEVMVNGSIPHGYEEDWSRVIVSIIDITERKEAAEKLRESEDRYHSLFQNQIYGSALHEIIANDDGLPVDYIFLKVNPAFEKMTGLEARDLLGRRVTEVLPGIENEGLIQIYGQVALTGQPIHINDYVTSLGNCYEIHAYATGPRRFAVSFMDVTERRQAEQELRKLSRAVEQSGSTIVITDTSGKIEYVNPKFTQTTGYSYEEVIGQNPRMLKSGLTGEEEYKQLWETIKNGGEWHGELLNKKKNGTLYWESVTISPILNERQEITHYVGVKEDITERKQSEIEIRRHVAELEAVYENGLSVGRLLEPGEIGDRVIETFARYLPWHHVTIRLRKDGSDDLELVSFNLPSLKEEERSDAEQHFVARINKVGQGLSGWVLQTGMPLRTGNVHAHPQYIDTHAGIQSGLYMPLKVGERVIGVISVESEVPKAFTEQDERLLATLANQTAIAFENARLYEAMQTELLERKRVEDALRVSETHYRALADSITDILFELDQDLHYTHWNKASETLTGIPTSQVIGRSMEEILGTTDEQIRIKTIYEEVLKSHRPRTFETILGYSGERRFFEVNAYPSTRGVSVVAKDVTDRKRTEMIMQKRFELMEFSAKHSLKELMLRTVDEVSELTGSAIGFFNFMEEDQLNLGVQTWSTNALQLFQVSPEDGTHRSLDRAGVWAEAVRQRRPVIHNNYESLANRKGLPQGHVPIIRQIVIPIIRNERIMAVLGIANKTQDYTSHDLEIAARLADYAWDITERKQMEIALQVERNQLVERVEERTADLSRANSNLARALRVKDEFLANMSHELRTPLNAILGLSESLGEQIAGPLNEKQQKYISTISESGHHLLSLINDILDLAKIEAGQISLDINKVDIHSVCQASLRMIKQLAQKKNQDVSLQLDPGMGLMWADERRLKQMIVNLLGNAVKFTPENGKLGLEVQGDEEANQITITVWDNGIGIKQEDLTRLFQPFVQLDSGLAREAPGTGLGLALVAQMARLHGGSVNAESEPGKGSRFTLVLPWEPAMAMDAASRMRITGKFRAIQFDATNKPTILLVEDTKEVVMMLKDYLELAGYKVFTAQDGIDGIVQARHVRPDLILMDVQMPHMDGFETTRKLRSDPNFRYTPIIALTALAMPHDRERCLEAGMDEYISKPVNLKALVRIIQSCLFEQESSSR